MAREVTEFVTPTSTDDLTEGSTNKYYPAASQVRTDINVEDGSTADQSAAEMQTSLLGQADADVGFVTSTPLSGEKKIYGVHINAAGNIEADNEDTAES